MSEAEKHLREDIDLVASAAVRARMVGFLDRALKAARNEGLEKAAERADSRAGAAQGRAEARSTDPNPDAATWDNACAAEAADLADEIRALKEMG